MKCLSSLLPLMEGEEESIQQVYVSAVVDEDMAGATDNQIELADCQKLVLNCPSA